ncbi:type II inositol-1,4,5-trisphosphate 5-phosphatase precursor, putative [Entamoeba invadens IP1]|uniref:Type II inositol-1,4,5-trisphosphate 5-phosphatase, putative n=1 Tax=Entamoeba invadens IP1 TaxID=370355 RepID=A0A0A1TYA5_ENTIV|nr:type II inositol-1,4,5-trisphosphate 5-phosphatase precursor, putative [Entamoeba invadens IP1]ELP86470.1 type II inositol-1,4,5-trisphosphate 5-phosphatase precursor, putative [Entamoeba invadens IP1]|eukprot:XP_004185816.1 type II inositol-1,4,5-trisphosphate 5-phosphatase precursor, putative [Entamoeba invadens IP1]
MDVPPHEIECYSLDPSNWRYAKMRSRIDEYSEKCEMTAMLVTYNVNEKIISKETLDYVMSGSDKNIDLIFIAIEEIDMSVSGFLKGNTMTLKATELAINVYKSFETVFKEKFVQLTVLQLGGVVLMGFCRESIRDRIKYEASGYEAVGMMGMANKGGIAYSFKMLNKTICVVGSHLAAHQMEIPKRNQNFQDIFNNIELVPFIETERENTMKRIVDHDIIFWMGDLNYRIDEEDATIREKISNGAGMEAFELTDQLLEQKRLKVPIVNTFVESPIMFQPTYKFIPNTQEYSEKRRPAFCDRILFRSESEVINCVEYTALPNALESDHKPVRGCFEFVTRKIIPDKHAKVEKELIEMENQLLRIVRPNVILEKQEFELTIYPYVSNKVVLPLKNDGKAKSTVCLKDYQIGKTGIFPDWLEVFPEKLEIEKTDVSNKNITFRFKFQFTDTVLLFQKGAFDYNLILEIKGGRTHFLSFKIHLDQTCLTKSIDDLNLHPNGYLLPQPQAYAPLIIPKEIWRLCDFVRPHLAEPNLLSTSPSKSFASSYSYILDHLDKHIEFDPNMEFHRALEFLIVFMKNLKDSVIPSCLFEQVVHSTEKQEEFEKFFVRNKMPNSHYNLFLYMIAFLKEIVKVNSNVTVEDVVKYFSAVFVRPVDGLKKLNEERAVENFLVKSVRK